MKFWKITNKDEVHHGLQIKTGLVEDPIPFNPSGNCLPGGIYFSDSKNIVHFFYFGPWIREVQIPEDVEHYLNPSDPKKWKSPKLVFGERRKIKDAIPELLENGLDKDVVLQWASGRGQHLKVVQLLLKHGANPNLNDGWALICAIENGNPKIVKLLLEHGANPRACDGSDLEYTNRRIILMLKKAMKGKK